GDGGGAGGSATASGATAAAVCLAVSAACFACPAAACALPPANNPATALSICKAPPPRTMRLVGSTLPTMKPLTSPTETMRPGVQSDRHVALHWRQSAPVWRSLASSAVSAWWTLSMSDSKLMAIQYSCPRLMAIRNSWRCDLHAEAFLHRLLVGGFADPVGGRFGRCTGAGVGHERREFADAQARQLPARRLQ